MLDLQPTGGGSAGSSGGLGLLLTGGPSPVEQWVSAPRSLAGLESAGCTAIWVPDHLFWGSPVPECLVMATVAAASTTTCTIGTGVLQAPLRRSAVVAKAAATLQEVSGGRFVLGLGTGEHRQEYARVGVDFDSRGRALDAAIAEIRDLWREVDDWYGQRPVPAPVPIWVGGRSPRALRRAAAVADGWMPIFLTPEGFTKATDELDEHLRRSGRPARQVTRAAVAMVTTTGPGWSRADALGWMGTLWRTDPARFARYLITGSAEECASELERYRNAGAEQVIALVPSHDPLEVFGALNGAFTSSVAP